MPVLRFLSARYWRRRWGRGAVPAAGVALGVGLMISVGLINQTIVRTYVDLTEALAGRADLEVRALSEQGLDPVWLQRVQLLDGVVDAVPLLERQSFLFHESQRTSLRVRGIDPATDASVRPLELLAGRPLAPEDDTTILLAAPLAESLRIRVGDAVELLTPEGFVAFRVVGTFAGLDPLNAPQSRVAIVPIRALQASYLGTDAIGQIDVLLSEDADPEQIESTLAALTASTGFVQRPLEHAEQVAELTEGVRFMLLLASIISLVASAFLIATNVTAALDERRRDLAVVRTLGVSRSRLQRWLLLEVLTFSTIGGSAGVGLGIGSAGLLARTVSGTLLAPFQSDVGIPQVTLSVLAAGFGLGLLISLLAAYPSIRRVSGGTVMASFPNPSGGHELVVMGSLRHYRWWPLAGLGGSVVAGLLMHLLFAPTRIWSVVSVTVVLIALLGVAAYLPGFLAGLGSTLRGLASSPLWLRLAADSLRQHRRRTGAVAASLMITLSILVAVFGMVRSYRSSVGAWVDDMFGWDLTVSSSPQGLRVAVPLDASVEAEIEDIPGVVLASPERYVLVGLGTSAVNLYAFDMADFSRMRRFESVSGIPSDDLPRALRAHRRVAISSTLAPKYGLDAGDVVELQTPRGTIPYQVAAVVEDPGAAAEAVYIDRLVYMRDWGDGAVDSFALLLESEADPEAVAASLKETFADRYPLQVVSAATFKADVSRMVTETFGLSQGLVLVAVLMALFGLLNAGMIGVWQLRRQLAILRALGAPLRLLSRALLAEAWLTSVSGGVIGLVMGTLLSSVLLRSLQLTSSLVVTWSWPFGGYALVAFVALLASLAAGYLPSKAAERTQLAEALRRE